MGSRVRPGHILSQVWGIYRNEFAVLIGMAVVLFAIQFILALILGSSLYIVVTVVFWIISTIYQGAVVELVSDVRDGRRDHSVGQMLRTVEPVVGPLLAVSVLFAIGVSIGFILIIIPGLILLTLWCVVAPVTVLEKPGIFSAFGRSRELVRGDGWSVFGTIILLYFTVVVISFLASALASGLGTGGRAIVQFIVVVLLAPVPALGASVLYFTLRGEPVTPEASTPSATS